MSWDTTPRDISRPPHSLIRAAWCRSGSGASSNRKWHARLRITNKQTSEVIYFDSALDAVEGRINICDWVAKDRKCHPRTHATTPVVLPPRRVPSAYDQSCGTSNLSPFQPGKGYNKICRNNVFMCSDESNYDHFASCFDALNCAMHDQMKVQHTGNCQELFINQMIPHHENAINMAKTVLKFAESELTSGRFTIPCAHDRSAMCPDLNAIGLLRGIVASQNVQIKFMRDYLVKSNTTASRSPSICVKEHDNAINAPISNYIGYLVALFTLVIVLAIVLVLYLVEISAFPFQKNETKE